MYERGFASRELMQASGKPQKYGFLLLPHFSMLAFSSAIETLHMANWISGKDLYRFCTISPDQGPSRDKTTGQNLPDAKCKEVVSSVGAVTVADYVLSDAPSDLDAVFICGASPAMTQE